MLCSARLASGPFAAAEAATVALFVTPDQPLGPGDTVEIQFPNSWLMVGGPSFTRKLQTAEPSGEHYVSVSTPGVAFDLAVTERNLSFPDGQARHGRLIRARVASGASRPGVGISATYANTVAPCVAERETIWVRVRGEVVDPLPEIVTLPGPAASVRLIAPSAAEPGRPFELLVVSLDRFDNRSATRFEDRTIYLVGRGPVARGLSFAGSTRVPVSIATEGVWRFSLDGIVSNAVRVAPGARGPYWGDLHIHSRLSSDAMGADPYGYAREVSGLDFAAVTDHTEDLGSEGYRQLLEWAGAASDPGRFVPILADERNPGAWTGHHNVYFRDEQTHLACRLRPGCFPRRSAAESEESVAEIRKRPDRCLVLPHHTGISWRALPPPGGRGDAVDLGAVEDDQGMRPVMEIYSHHGQSERYDPGHALAYELNRMRNSERRSNTSTPGPHWAQTWWAAGRRMGVIGSSDEHSGQGGRRNGGIAAVWAEELSAQGVFDALRCRRCYATTGERILLDFSVDGIGMGQQGARAAGSTLRLRLAVWGTEGLVRLDILRCRLGADPSFVPVHSDSPRGPERSGVPELTLDTMVEITDVFTGPTVYYARVTQMPVERPGMAWSSPVWVEMAGG